MGPDDDRLNHAAFADAFGQFLQRAFVEMATRLFRVRLDQRDLDGLDCLARWRWSDRRDRFFARDVAEQRGQATAQPVRALGHFGLFAGFVAQAATSCRGRRAISSRASRI